jgi:hypothetical protein
LILQRQINKYTNTRNFCEYVTGQNWKISGLTAVSSSILVRPPGFEVRYVYFCWIQLETNIAVKITAASCDAKTFNALTNSLQSLKINEKGILKLVATQK